VQERDGYQEQVGALRDKVSGLARQVAEQADSCTERGGHVAEVEGQLREACDARDAADAAAAQAQAALKAQVEEMEGALEGVQERQAKAERAWAAEKARITQVRALYSTCPLRRSAVTQTH
jgi:chromosome segregation ATPase